MLRRLILVLSAVLTALPAARATPIISEFMASNDTTIADQNGDYADWLELYNPDATADNLAGYYLTNKASKLTKWELPAVSLAPGAYLVVFCSEKNYTNPGQPLAANFNLSASGGYVALVKPDGKTVASSYTYLTQYPDVSYGVSQPTSASEAPQTGYFLKATPGAANGNYTNILLPDMATLSAAPGIFTGSVAVTVGGAGSGEHARYVLSPGAAMGGTMNSNNAAGGFGVVAPTAAATEYSAPLSVTATTLVKASVFAADDSQQGLPATAFYLQLDNSTSNRLDTFSSNLPLVVFDDNGFGLLPDDDTYYPGWIAAFSPAPGGTTTLTQAADFFTPDSMKLHGFTSASFPKQSYDIDLADTLGSDLDEPFFGMDSEKSWDSIGTWNYDRTFIRNGFVYNLARSMGHWAAQTRMAEMFIHSAGGILDYTSYAGVTAITDRIKVDSTRVNIYSLNPNDVTAPNVTGGYILRIDHPESDLYAWTTPGGVPVMLDTPKLDVLVSAQTSYLVGYVQQMENAMNADLADGFTTHTYQTFIDLPSWVDYHLLNVLTENVDAFEYSEYFSKDVDGLVVAGPVWDYDRSMGSADGRDANPQTWSSSNSSYWTIGWWGLIARDPEFMQAWVDRWQGLRTTTFSNSNLTGLINNLAAQVGPAAAARDEARWPDDQSRFGGAYSGEIANLNTWILTRAAWIDSQFVAPPTVALAGTSRIVTPATGTQLAYTTDGSDPRLPGGGLAPAAALSGVPVALPATSAFAARSYEPAMAQVFPGSPWSSPVGSPARLINVSGRTTVGTGSDVLVEGFVVAGPVNSQEQVLLRAVGPTLASFGLGGSETTQPSLSVFDSTGTLLASNTGWSTSLGSGAVANAAATVGAFALPADSADSALLLNLTPGNYTMQVSGSATSSGIALGEVYEVGSSGARVVNFSSRGEVAANGSMVTGLVISGTAAEQVLVRGDGPALAAFGVADPLATPLLQVYDAGGNLVAGNSGWSTNANATAIAAAASTVGAFALTAGSADCALLLTLQPGAYTMVITAPGGGSGVALAESYVVP